MAVAIKEGNDEAFQFFFKKYYKFLLAYISTFTNDRSAAEDIVQQSFIVLWEKRALLEVDKSPKHYLYAIAQNQYKKTYKNLRKRDAFFEELKERSLKKMMIEDIDFLEEQLNRLNTIIETLPPRCREILVLNKYEGLKYREIANRLQVSIKTVESQMRIAYQKIRQGFKENTIILALFFNDFKRGRVLKK
ncbi:MAG: RNA polymerase sigma factor [Flavobacteriaceae bacterium]